MEGQQQDHEFEVSLNCIVRPYLKKKIKRNSMVLEAWLKQL
jgi:hypothetical protein